MANFYWVRLDNENLTQEVAAEIFAELSKHCLVRHFTYAEGGHISYNTRGLIRLEHILEKYGIDEDEMEIEDEFQRFYKSLTPQEYERLVEENKKYVPIVQEKMNNKFPGFSF